MLLQILRDEFPRRKARNSKYSLRAYANALKIHSSSLSAILNEKRKITPQQAQKILLELGINPKERKTILLKLIEKSDSAPATYHELAVDTINIISGWEHFAILSCLDIDGGWKLCRHIANRLKLTEVVVQEALERLEKFNLVQRQDEFWKATGQNFTTTHEIPCEAVRKINREYINKALNSLERHSVDERDVTGITMAVSSKKLPEAKKLIANFRREMAEFLEVDGKDHVYRLNIQLFPLTK